MTMTDSQIDQLCGEHDPRAGPIDTVLKANSGHPGLPLGAAPVGYSLFARRDESTTRRTRRGRTATGFVLSAGHGSALLYSLLHLTGYDLPLDELKQFRQWGQPHPRPPGVRRHARRGDDHRPPRPGLRDERRISDRRGPSRPRGTTGRGTRSSITARTCSPETAT